MRKNVLIFPAGTEIAFEILHALKYSKFVRIYGGTSAHDHSEFVYKNLISDFPYVQEEGFLDFLNRIIHEYKIDCIYPAHDSVSVFLSEHMAEINAQVIVADRKTTSICRSKRLTYNYLSEFDFIPHTYESIEEVKEYPVFVKPEIGQGSQGAQKILDKNALQSALREDPSLIICEYLPGMEYTVDCFTDKNGKLLVTKIRKRERIRTGISVRSRQCEVDDRILQIANILNERFDFVGAWFFQVKKNEEGKYKLLEISPRIPGTMGLSRNLGINFPMLTLYAFWGEDVSIIDNAYGIVLDRAFYSAYEIDYEYEHVYVDYDDTLVIENKVNANLMFFLYQAAGKGKKIHLLSRHVGDIKADMQEAKISEYLFDEICVISSSDEKWNYIREKKAIFIDDSFAERKKVHDALGIAVFDVDMVECLMDWKA